ncbi:MAG TPA: MarR family transcriptional regulator [Dehalococcoidia bacterium]|nr:MarR family transcriptional regulator [Dehalococcoidia bacterium]
MATGGKKAPDGNDATVATQTRARRRGDKDDGTPSADAVLRRIERYHAAFGKADLESIGSHIVVVNTGLLMQQAVTRFLTLNFDINPARYSLLRALYFSPEKKLPQNQVAREMGTSPPNVTQLLDALERDGLVERVINRENRRITYARMTEAGIAKCDQMVPAMVGFMEKTMEVLSANEKGQLENLLLKLRVHLAELLSV